MKRCPWIAVVLACLAPSCLAQEEPPIASPDESRAVCTRDARGLGTEKVKAGDEHCGFVSRVQKTKALDTACSLSEEHRGALQSFAEEKARDQCSASYDRRDIVCSGELREWQNVYTHVLSQRCWAECGWAFVIDCEPSSRGG